MSEYNVDGYTVLLDEEDAHLLDDYKFHILRGKYTDYIMCDGRNIADYIMKPVRLVVDHKNRNGLDNRKENLFVCTYSLNVQKSPVKSYKKFRGAYYRGTYLGRPCYASFITHKGKYIWIGMFRTEEDAACAYNKKVYELYGENAYFNRVYCTTLWL